MKPTRYSVVKRQGIEPRIKIWLEKDGRHIFGAGIRDILRAIETSGSIKSAAPLVGRSYRRIWSQIKELEAVLGAPLVETRVGGKKTSRSALTQLATQLMAEYDLLQERIADLVRKEFSA